MNCPVCQKSMKEQDFGGVVVDICTDGCKGIWFGWFELSKLDEKNEGVGQALQAALQYPRNNEGNRPAINCPKCSLPLHVHKYASQKEINVDECYQCGGFFLDSGELTVIRDKFMTPQEEDAYLKKLVDDVPSFKQAEVDLKKKQTRNEALRRYTRFLRLSYYATGK